MNCKMLALMLAGFLVVNTRLIGMSMAMSVSEAQSIPGSDSPRPESHPSTDQEDGSKSEVGNLAPAKVPAQISAKAMSSDKTGKPNDGESRIRPEWPGRCNISVVVENKKKLGTFILKQLEGELNKIFVTGGADIHVTLLTAGTGDYALQIQDSPPKASNSDGVILAQTSKEDPHNSVMFVKAIEATWEQIRSLPLGGRGVVYARVYAHELAAHGILGWRHSQRGDENMGFVGSGKNWGDFLFNNHDDTIFEFTPAQGKLLNLQCHLGGRVRNPGP
jgi:hypothetical protein